MGVGLGRYADSKQGGLVRPVAKICFMLRPFYALCDKRLGLLEVSGVKALGEPAIDRSE